jgi:hypothetical protein
VEAALPEKYQPEWTRGRVTSFFLTTAIDYANGDPHLGHAFEKVGADCIAVIAVLRGDDVWFLMGMDEHGQKVAQAAAADGVTPQALVDRVAGRFESTWDRLSVSRDQFIRTTSPAHQAGVQELIVRIFERNPDDFYERAYSGLYCVGCEAFKQPSEIVDGKCGLHPTLTLEMVSERNWFFRLSRYQDFLRRLLEANPDFIRPESRRNEIIGLLDQGLDAGVAFGGPVGGLSVNAAQAALGGADDVCVVRRTPQLLDRDAPPGRPRQLAGAAARRGQGHHPVPLRHLAGDARGGRSPVARRHLGTRLRAARW